MYIGQVPTLDPQTVTFDDAEEIFVTMQKTIDPLIDSLFGLISNVFDYFVVPVTLASIIYIALMGYAFMSGYIVMSGRELAVRLSKVVFALVAFEFFRSSGSTVYNWLWDIPLSLGNALVSIIQDLPASGYNGTAFEDLMTQHGAFSKELAVTYTEADAPMSTSLMIWIISMAPLAVILLTFAVAKFISLALFLMLPIVLLLSLTSVNTPFITSWAKAVLVTLITVILLFLLGGVSLTLLEISAIDLAKNYEASGQPITIPIFWVYGVFCLLAVVLIGQCTSIASSIVGATAFNTQQGTSLMQIGALNAAR